MTSQPTAAIALEIEELPDGVRYVLPRRRRRGWAALIWHAAVALFFYFTVPTFLVWLVVDQNAPGWLLLIALGAVLLFLIGGLGNIRNALAILATPDAAIELRTGRIIVVRKTLVRTATEEVPLGDVRRLTVRGLGPWDDPAGPAEPSRKRLGWLRQWFSAHPLEEMDRAERRKQDILRFFGSLLLEGDGGAEIALAEEYGRSYLTSLADDLTNRMKSEKSAVSVEQDGPWPAVIVADDSRLNRPGQITNIKIERMAGTFVFEVPAPGISYGPLLGGAVVTAFTLFVASWFIQALAWPPRLPDFCALVFIGSFLVTGIGAARVGFKAALFGLTRTVIVTSSGRLSVRFEWPIGSRTREWCPGEAAACVIDERATKNKEGKAALVYDLTVLDHALRGFIILQARPEAELEWVAAVIHKELALGGGPETAPFRQSAV